MKEKIFIGVAWPYANGSLHLGHIAGCYLPADIFARFHRLLGNDVLMVSGSDEHGTPITITADKEKISPQAVVDRFHNEHVDNMKKMGISFDLFTRTTTSNHEKIVQEFFTSLYKKQLIYSKTVESFYCETCQKYLPDRYVEGVCPHCQHEGARGDQCDQCGKLIDSCELVEVICKICGDTPKLKTSDHFFFSLSSFEEDLLKWVEQKTHWKANVQKFTYNWLKGGLHDRAITRDIQWGVPVPLEGYEGKRIYVWFDAVIGYFSASVQWAQANGKPKKWEEWWLNDSSRHYYFLAKDNIPFHSIIWPSILMAYNKQFQLPYDIPANEYLCLKGEQFSKSRCVAVWVPDILKQFDPDAIRYYLSINMPENKDANWLWDDFVAKNNDELVGTYGNFAHRVLSFTYKNYGVIPKKFDLTDMDQEALRKIKETSKQIKQSLLQCSFKKALRTAMSLAQFGNVYFDHYQPWKLVKEDKERCGTVLHVCLQLLQALAIFTHSFLPFSSVKLWNLIGNNDAILSWDQATQDLSVGVKIPAPQPLYEKVSMEECIMNEDPFSKVDLRTAKIIDVEDHPQADKLYVITVDVGELGKRTLVAGMKPYYSIEEMQQKTIVIVANLKPAKLRGIESQGMLLAAEDDQGVVSLLNPGESPAGTSVTTEGIEKDPVKELPFDEFQTMNLHVNNQQQIVYNEKLLKSNGNIVTVDRKVTPGAKVK